MKRNISIAFLLIGLGLFALTDSNKAKTNSSISCAFKCKNLPVEKVEELRAGESDVSPIHYFLIGI